MTADDPDKAARARRPFHVMTKPIGPLCNLKCSYCFYLEKEQLFSGTKPSRMNDELLETYVRAHCRSQRGPEVQFAWQGGEPTLMGLDFFRKAVALQRVYAGGRTVHNALQTNGTLLDDEWGRFLSREHFLVGLSLDGPEPIHNRYRKDSGGTGSFDRVMRGLEILQRWRVEFNTLSCVTRESPDEAVEIYRFLKQAGVTFMQFIPIVERMGDPSGETLAGAPSHGPGAAACTTPWSVSPDGFGRFLCSIFDEWIKQDVGRIFVNLFDVALSAWCGMEPNLCTFAVRCGDAVALEHDGSVYACDHYVYPSHRLGHLMEQSLEEIAHSEQQKAFGRAKRETLTAFCRRCDYLFACNGDCPKHRFARSPDGEEGLSYLCPSYKLFFRHVDPGMRDMAQLVRAGRSASDIMQKQPTPTSKTPSRNDPCPCGSGRKFKKCCGR